MHLPYGMHSAAAPLALAAAPCHSSDIVAYVLKMYNENPECVEPVHNSRQFGSHLYDMWEVQSGENVSAVVTRALSSHYSGSNVNRLRVQVQGETVYYTGVISRQQADGSLYSFEVVGRLTFSAEVEDDCTGSRVRTYAHITHI